MISHKHKCIFIHIPKAAGTSVETVFLNDLELDFEDKLPLLLGASTNLYMEPRVISHLTAQQMVDQHYISQELFDTYFKFALVRNPVDRLFSTYKYWGYGAVVSFDTFVKKALPRLLEQPYRRFFLLPQTDYLYSNEGRLLVDKICYFERLNEDLRPVFRKAGIELDRVPHSNKAKPKANAFRGLKKAMEMPVLLKYLNLNQKRTKELSEEAIQVVRTIYASDFDRLDYSI